VVALLNAGIPVLDMLEPELRRRPVNPDSKGAAAFERIENTRLARYARDFLLQPQPPEPAGIATSLQKDLEVAKLRLIECRQPRDLDVWLHSLLNVARTVNPYLPPDEAAQVWSRFSAAPCYGSLRDFQRRWLDLFAAVAQRNGDRIAQLANALLDAQADLGRDAREYVVVAGMIGAIAAGRPQDAKALWTRQEAKLRDPQTPLMRLLRCHAERGAANADAACAAAFAAYAG